MKREDLWSLMIEPKHQPRLQRIIHIDYAQITRKMGTVCEWMRCWGWRSGVYGVCVCLNIPSARGFKMENNKLAEKVKAYLLLPY